MVVACYNGLVSFYCMSKMLAAFHGGTTDTLLYGWLSFRCWGLYIEGVAVYGRDPTLTCAYSYFLSTEGSCPYMRCYYQPTGDNTTETHVYQPMETPDWRNCSGYIP